MLHKNLLTTTKTEILNKAKLLVPSVSVTLSLMLIRLDVTYMKVMRL